MVQAVGAVVDRIKHTENAEKNIHDQRLEKARKARRKSKAFEFNEVSIGKQNGITVFDIEGDITANTESSLYNAYRQVCVNSPSKFLLKLRNDAYINSGGIAVLIQLLADARRNEHIVGITGLSKHHEKIFNMVGITKLATIYSTLESALKNM